MSLRRNRALFLDRDGVINVDKSYLYKIEDFELVEGIVDLIRFYQNQGYLPIVVTNQSGIGRGYYTQEEYMKLTEYMVCLFAKEGVRIEAIYHCPHIPEDRCSCRKPRIGMFSAAQKAHQIDMKNSVMIGDKESDMEAAYRAKVSERILLNAKGESLPRATRVIKSLKEMLQS